MTNNDCQVMSTRDVVRETLRGMGFDIEWEGVHCEMATIPITVGTKKYILVLTDDTGVCIPETFDSPTVIGLYQSEFDPENERELITLPSFEMFKSLWKFENSDTFVTPPTMLEGE